MLCTPFVVDWVVRETLQASYIPKKSTQETGDMRHGRPLLLLLPLSAASQPYNIKYGVPGRSTGSSYLIGIESRTMTRMIKGRADNDIKRRTNVRIDIIGTRNREVWGGDGFGSCSACGAAMAIHMHTHPLPTKKSSCIRRSTNSVLHVNSIYLHSIWRPKCKYRIFLHLLELWHSTDDSAAAAAVLLRMRTPCSAQGWTSGAPNQQEQHGQDEGEEQRRWRAEDNRIVG